MAFFFIFLCVLYFSGQKYYFHVENTYYDTSKSLMYFFLLLFSKVSWYKDGRAVHYDKTHLADQHGSLFMLRLKEITINDLGNYTCEAENSQGLARDHIELSGIIKKSGRKTK